MEVKSELKIFGKWFIMTKEIKVTVVEASEIENYDEDGGFTFKHPAKYLKTVGWLGVVSKNYNKQTKKTFYDCECNCGIEYDIRSDQLKEVVKGSSKKHQICTTCFQVYHRLPSKDFRWIEDHPKYAVSSSGIVWSVQSQNFLSGCVDSHGYVIVMLGKKLPKKVHRLVAKAFIENQENKPCVNHKNGIKSDNKVDNLEWATYSENSEHASRIGLTSTKGEAHPKTKLSSNDVVFIKESSEKLSVLAELFDVHSSTIRRIKNGEFRKDG